MSAAIVQKAYEDVQAKAMATTTPVRYADLDKFALQTFNRLAYEREVSGPLVASCLLDFPDHYSHDIKLWYINLNLICHCFTSIIFYRSSILQSLEDDAIYTGFAQPPTYILEHYQCKGVHLFEFCLYTYFATISVVKRAKSSKLIFEFEKSYPHKSDLIQKHHTKPGSDFLIALIDNLSHCQVEEDAISDGHLDIISQQNDLAEVLLALFIPWQHLSGMFINADATTYKQFCWDLWSKYERFLPPYIKALATNIRNLQKSKIDVVLDMAMRQANAETSQSMEIDDLFANLEIETDFGNLSNDDQIRILSTLEESVSFVLQQ